MITKLGGEQMKTLSAVELMRKSNAGAAYRIRAALKDCTPKPGHHFTVPLPSQEATDRTRSIWRPL